MVDISRRLLFALTLGAALVPGAAQAQTVDFSAMALDATPDRVARIQKAAEAEGILIVYGSAPMEDMSTIFSAFEAKYHIKVRYWRAGPQEVIRRAETEYRAGRYEADIVQANGPTMEALRRENLFQKVLSKAQDDLLPQAVPDHHEWVGERLNIVIGAYNTKSVPAASVPATYEDFSDPSWKGKLAVEATDYDWFATVVSAMGEQKGIATFREIASKNGLSVRKGHTLLTALVAAGEVPVSLNVFTYKVDQLVKEGAPIAPLLIPPAVGRVNGIAAMRRPSHPNAALLYYEFMLTDAQHILMARDFTPTNQRVQALPAGLVLQFVDSAKLLDEGDKWTKLWKEITSLRPAN
ncbi:MAG: fbpA 2 [Hyphomicrobiales bacterium]|nr:fbpA 2 [Hyphomicrobiales bacterium]